MTLSLQREIHNERQDLLKRLIVLDQQEREILTGNMGSVDPTALTFGKNVISWGHGKTLPLMTQTKASRYALPVGQSMMMPISRYDLLLVSPR